MRHRRETYSLTYKSRNKTLRGTKKPDGTYEYETPVAYWMPFNGGIGFHDATWQSSFGGNRYLSHGSHGCVNMPKDKRRHFMLDSGWMPGSMSLLKKKKRGKDHV